MDGPITVHRESKGNSSRELLTMKTTSVSGLHRGLGIGPSQVPKASLDRPRGHGLSEDSSVGMDAELRGLRSETAQTVDDATALHALMNDLNEVEGRVDEIRSLVQQGQVSTLASEERNGLQSEIVRLRGEINAIVRAETQNSTNRAYTGGRAARIQIEEPSDAVLRIRLSMRSANAGALSLGSVSVTSVDQAQASGGVANDAGLEIAARKSQIANLIQRLRRSLRNLGRDQMNSIRSDLQGVKLGRSLGEAIGTRMLQDPGSTMRLQANTAPATAHNLLRS
jgi:hypothetical protein